MRIVRETITWNELKQAAVIFEGMVKAVVDVDRELMALDAELHSDLEALLLKEGSRQESLWGINLYPELPEADFIEYDSMINLRPSRGNRSRSVENEGTRKRIARIVAQRIGR